MKNCLQVHVNRNSTVSVTTFSDYVGRKFSKNSQKSKIPKNSSQLLFSTREYTNWHKHARMTVSVLIKSVDEIQRPEEKRYIS